MKIMWLCNTLIPKGVSFFKINNYKSECWISAVLDKLYNKKDIEIVYLFPYKNEFLSGNDSNIKYISYNERKASKYDRKLVTFFEKCIFVEKPDVIHIFGTESSHAYSLFSAAKNLGVNKRVIASIQGLVSVYSRHYNAFLPFNVICGKTFRDFLKNDSVKKQTQEFRKQGVYEIALLQELNHVFGRTDWDYACVKQTNPKINYHHCGEILRPSFYKYRWDYGVCKKHSIFFSQCYSPVKGFHLLLEAIGILKKNYSDVHVFTTGRDFIHVKGFQKVKVSKYMKYCRKLVKKYDLSDNITFLGYLDETNMRRAYLEANVFVSASSIENSPNSVGEAMILGVPIVSSDVGGVKNFITHTSEGFIYPADEPYMLAYYIDQVFNMKKEQLDIISNNAHEKAIKIHNVEKNMLDLLNVYEFLNSKKER